MFKRLTFISIIFLSTIAYAEKGEGIIEYFASSTVEDFAEGSDIKNPAIMLGAGARMGLYFTQYNIGFAGTKLILDPRFNSQFRWMVNFGLGRDWNLGILRPRTCFSMGISVERRMSTEGNGLTGLGFNMIFKQSFLYFETLNDYYNLDIYFQFSPASTMYTYSSGLEFGIGRADK